MAQSFGKFPFILSFLSPIISSVVYICTSRAVILLFTTTFSILVIMLLLGIVTVDDVAKILSLSPSTVVVLNKIVANLKEVCGNISGILSQMLNKLLSVFGSSVDLSKINIDINNINSGKAGSINQ
jgi:hypothetical protein